MPLSAKDSFDFCERFIHGANAFTGHRNEKVSPLCVPLVKV